MDIFWDATEGFLDHEALALPGCCMLSLVCVGVLNGQDPIHALHRARLAPAACRTWNDFMDFMDFM